MKSLDSAVGFNVSKTNKRISRWVAQHLKAFDITVEQWSTLKQLSIVNNITQKELAERSDKDPATLTKILDLLEKHELIYRLKNPDDRRSFLISITDKGLLLQQQAAPIVEEAFVEITKQIEPKKLAIFEEVLLSLQKNIDEQK